nr:hypothetical protein CFP56_60948 [Quercus suber]
MDSTTIAPLDPVVMAQQIQSLTANVQELMKQNEYLKQKVRPKGIMYDGTKDPLDHIGAFKMISNLQQTPDEERETLRKYVKHFNKAVLEIDKADDQVIMMTFQVGLNNPNLVFSLGKTPPTSMTNLLFKAQKYMNGEDALTAKRLTSKRKKEERTESQGKKRDRKDNLSKAKARKSGPKASSKKMLNFTPLLMPVDKILMQIKDNPALKWPKLLSSSSKRKDSKKYCHFYKDHCHYTDEC